MSYKVELKNGKILYPDGKEDFSKGNFDPYQKAFHGALLRRKTCEKCNYVRFPRQGDFSIGDFWGIELHDSSWNDGRGTSLVLVNNNKAKKILDKIKSEFLRIEEVPLEWCLNKGNRVGFDSRQTHPSRDYFEWLVKRKTFKEAVNMAMDEKYDIGCVCMFNLNIGNNLTNFALYRVLTGLGYSVLMIGPPFDSEKSEQFRIKKRFGRFIRNPYESWAVHDGYLDKKQYYQLNDKCSMFLVGSDQLWRGSCLKGYDYFFALDWVRSDKYKVSYATSLGTKDYDADDFCFNKEAFLLDRFAELSVREKSGADIIKKMIGKKSRVVLDPVFLCDVSEYEKMSNLGVARLPKSSFIGAYLLDITDQKENILISISNKKTKGTYCAITDFPYPSSLGKIINCMEDCANEEWLAVIRNSEFFITDSFHGICFAIIFKKQFAVIFDKNNWRGFSRIKNILELFGLDNRILDNDNNSEIERICSNTIDYEYVYSVLNKKIQEDYSYLESLLSKNRSYKSKYSSYDMLLEIQDSIHKNICELNNDICEISKEIGNIKENIMKIKSDNYIKTLESKDAKSEIVLFSAGTCFFKNISKIRNYLNLKYICDNDYSKWGKNIEGLLCISPADLKKMHDPVVIIMHDNICISFDIAKQLVQMGITKFDNISNLLSRIDMHN